MTDKSSSRYAPLNNIQRDYSTNMYSLVAESLPGCPKSRICVSRSPVKKRGRRDALVHVLFGQPHEGVVYFVLLHSMFMDIYTGFA